MKPADKQPGQFSFNNFCRSPWYGIEPDMPRTIEACARAGFDQFAPDCLSLSAWLAQRRSLQELVNHIRDAGLETGPLAACAMLDGSEQALEQLLEAARMAQVLGTRLLQVNVTGDSARARADAVTVACERLAEVGDYRLALEFMPISGLATLAETLDIVAIVGADHAGALVDIWHLSHDPQGWETFTKAPLAAIAYVETDDALPPAGDDLLAEMMDRRTYPGEGVLDTRRFAELLAGKGYEGPISVEILNRQLIAEPLESFASKALETSRNLFRLAI